MTRVHEWTLIGGVALLAAAAGMGYNVWRTAPPPVVSAAATLMAAQLPDLKGQRQKLGQWQGKVLVVNFWATWCAPCREEIPVFVKLQDKYGPRGLQFVGVAIDDAQKVEPYAAELQMNFPVLLGGIDGIELARSAGNRSSVLPFTVIVGRDGRIAHAQPGAVKEAQFESLVASLL